VELVGDPYVHRGSEVDSGREQALREFSLDDMLRKTRRLYEEVLGSSQVGMFAGRSVAMSWRPEDRSPWSF
jgi:hypothetical protein